MSKFNVGDKIKVVKGTITGTEGVITEVGEMHNYGFGVVDQVYHIQKDNGNIIELREGILERVDGQLSLFEESINQTIKGDYDNE